MPTSFFIYYICLRMNSFISIFLSFYLLLGAIIPNSDFHELSKLPELVAHFAEHEKNTDNSFFRFMELHYGLKDGTKDHHQESHENLPFNEHNTGHTHVYVSFQASIDFEAQVEPVRKNFTEYQSIISSEYSYSIFQPPRA